MADGGLGYNAPNAAAGFASGLAFVFFFFFFSGSFPAGWCGLSAWCFFSGFRAFLQPGQPRRYSYIFARLSSSAETPKLLDPMEMEHRGQKQKARASYFGGASCDQNVGGNKSCVTLKTLNYGNCGILLILG